MKILVAGDSYYRSDAFRRGLAPLLDKHEVEFIDMDADTEFQPRDDSEQRLAEFEGNPDQIVASLTDHDVLVVHGAPVSATVLQASPNLALVCCVRGGPVNVDIKAASDFGIPVATTPGKNAPAVAELTIALAVMLVRDVQAAGAYLQQRGRLSSAFDGSRFFGSELSAMTLGLVGFGRVGFEVCSRARGFGMKVRVYDPYVEVEVIQGVGATPCELIDLARSSNIVSLHARQTSGSLHMINGGLLAEFRTGSYLINTAREGLVDEGALLAALRSGRLAGVAVDVFEPDGALAEAIYGNEDRLIALPHIGGATHNTMDRASALIVDHIERFATEHRPVKPDHGGMAREC